MNANGSQSAYTVLIADDNRDTVETLSALVRFEGHQVIEAHCGAQAQPTRSWPARARRYLRSRAMHKRSPISI